MQLTAVTVSRRVEEEEILGERIARDWFGAPLRLPTLRRVREFLEFPSGVGEKNPEMKQDFFGNSPGLSPAAGEKRGPIW